MEFWEIYCERIFEAKLFPDVDHWNIRYGEKHPHITKVIYTNGEEDPWKHASILEHDDVANNEGIHVIEMKCNGCAHCKDLGADREDDPKEVTAARADIMKIFKKWMADELVAESKGLEPAHREGFLQME